MLLLKSIRARLPDRSIVRPKAPTCVHFHSAYGFHTQTLAYTLDSLVRVSSREDATHYASIRDNSVSHPSVPAGSIHAPAITPHPEQVRLHSGPFSPAAKTDAGPASRVEPPAHEEQRTQPAMSEQLPFPFNNFTCCFTLFSKCFSSFHHCTCSLSVSRLYLALDGVYHPL